MDYKAFKYIFPPRPEVKTSPDKIDDFDNGEYIAQPKYNGSACVVFTNGREVYIYNRHKMQLANCSKEINFKGLAKSKDWYVYAGEYLNKGKFGELQTKEKDKYVIWDCLVWKGEYLVGKTLNERLTLLENIYPCQRAIVTEGGEMEIYEHLCCTEIKGIYKAPTYTKYFKSLYEDLIKVDLYEGLVLKKIDSKLTFGFNEVNNNEWQIKIRKPTKIYNF